MQSEEMWQFSDFFKISITGKQQPDGNMKQIICRFNIILN